MELRQTLFSPPEYKAKKVSLVHETNKGWGRVANTARGKAECCICHETPPCVLYFILLYFVWVDQRVQPFYNHNV